MDKVNLREKLSQFTEHWQPRIVGELNGQHVKLAKLKGEFVWHYHEDEDEMFYVVQGRLRLRFRGDETGCTEIDLEAGEFLIVPRGVEHQPVADDEVHVMLFEPAGTRNTGNVQNDHTLVDLERL